MKEMNNRFFLRKEITRPPKLWNTVKNEVFICMRAIRDGYNAGKTGGAFNIVFGNIAIPER